MYIIGMKKILVLVACLCGFGFADWTKQCRDIFEVKVDYVLKTKDKFPFGSWKIGNTTRISQFGCSCTEEIDCGDGETRFCVVYKCGEESLSVFNAGDIQRFRAYFGSGGTNLGNAGQP